MQPVGTNNAASFPKISAARFSSRFTVGSSPYASSPTSASAIARRISGVGVVTVSERRSTTPDGDAMARHRPDQTFLHYRDRQRAVAPEDLSRREAACPRRCRALLVIQQPLVGTERT